MSDLNNFLIGFAAELSAAIVPGLARRLRDSWQGDAGARAIEACLYTGLATLALQATAASPDEEALLTDIFRDYFLHPEVRPHLLNLARGNEPAVEEFVFLFEDLGYDASTLPGLDFRQGIKAFSAAFLARAVTEEALQGVIAAEQTLKQTRLLRDLVAEASELADLLRRRPGGTIHAGNYVVGTQVVYQWGSGAGPQTLEAAYLRTLIGRCNRLDLTEVDERVLDAADDGVQLTDVFTTLYAARGEQVIVRRSGQSVAEALKPPRGDEMDQMRRRKDDDDAQPLAAAAVAGALSRLVILGHPGGGKSTLVNYLATELARRRLNPGLAPLPEWPAQPLLPVRIVLRRFAAWLVDETPAVPHAKAGLVWRYLQEKLLSDWGCANAYDHLWRVLQEEGGVIFFDGLDEVPETVDDARRTLMKEAILDFARPLAACKVIITCREYAYRQDDAWRLPDAQFPVIDLALFQEEQIRGFAATWYRVMGPRLEWDEGQQQAKAERLADAVLARAHLRELGQYPLLLTLMAQVHVKHDLPDNRAELYDLAVNLLLSHWENRLVRGEDGRRHMEPGLIARLGLRREEVRSVLAELAFTVHERQEQQQGRDGRAADISRDELWEGLKPLAGGYDRANEVTEYIQTRAGLLQAREGFTYAFPHRTFQEFLAAAHVWSLPEDPIETLYACWARDNAWWQEVFLLAAGQARTDAYRVKSLIDRLVPASPDIDQITTVPLNRITLAAQIIHETNFMRFVTGREKSHPYVLLVDRVRAWLERALVAEDLLTPSQRAAVGRVLGLWVEDQREGVGVVVRDGMRLPDIAWGEWLPAGTYTVGGDKDAYQSFDSKEVHIPHDFRLSRYPITYTQFQCFVEAEDFDDARWWFGLPETGLDFFGDEYSLREIASQALPYINGPRELVSWYQALAFCRWLSDRLGQTISLPHEYEWEVAARYPDGRFYPWGNEYDFRKINIDETGIGQTTAVGMYPSGRQDKVNLYDLSGNIWEWCRNEYSKPDENMDPDSIDVTSPRRVLRGGSFIFDRYDARVTSRGGDDIFYRLGGFRIVMVRPSLL